MTVKQVTHAAVRQDLIQSWHYQREAEFRRNQKAPWTNEDSRLKLHNSTPTIDLWAVECFWNKPTAFYWLPAATIGHPIDPNYRHTPGIIFAALYEEWRRCSVGPNIEFGHFLAAHVRVTMVGPEILRGIADAHLCIHTQAETFAKDVENYEAHPLFPAIMLVCDRIDIRMVKPEADGFISLREVARLQSVLVIHTGSRGAKESDGLSQRPIVSLDSLAEFALPFERDDCGIDVVRVPLSVAVRFIVELEGRLSLGNDPVLDWRLCGLLSLPVGYDHSLAYSPQLWADAILAERGGNGYEMDDALHSIERVKARLEGRVADYESEHEPFGRSWKP